jgi:nitrite reductase (NADH) small subunit
MTRQGGAPVRDARVAAGGEAPAVPVGGAPAVSPGKPLGGAPAPREPAAWVRVCPLDRLQPGRGVASLVGAEQVALFRVRLAGGDDVVFALANLDPFSGAQVLARGLVGDAAGVPKVASPLYKQAFDLRTGVCLDNPAVSVPSYAVRVGDDGWVAVGVSP